MFVVTSGTGSIFYYLKIEKQGKYTDILHREDGPAIEWNDGSKEWWLYGQRHRIDGPAVESWNMLKEWWIQDKQYSEEEYWRVVKLKGLW